MDISNLTVDMEIKNYKELCSILGEKVSSGNTKKAQLKELECYCKYHKVGNKFIIDEIYEVPKNKTDKRSEGNGTVYGNMIQDLIMDLLVQQKEEDKNITLSTCKLLESLKMINANYSYCKEHIPKLSTFMNMDAKYIYEFYDSTHSNLKNAVETALNHLQDKSLIFWTKELTVCVEEIQTRRNKLGKIELSDIDLEEYDISDMRNKRNRIQYDVIVSHRLANDEEIELILQAEKDIMEQMGFKSKKDIIACNLWKNFVIKVNTRLHKEANILYYYKSYKIICNRKYILKEYEDMQLFEMTDFARSVKQTNLNNTIIDGVNINAEKRRDRALEEAEGWIGKPKLKPKEELRINKNYLDNESKLTDTLINKNKKDMTNIIKYIKPRDIKDKTLNDESFGLDNEELDEALAKIF